MDVFLEELEAPRSAAMDACTGRKPSSPEARVLDRGFRPKFKLF